MITFPEAQAALAALDAGGRGARSETIDVGDALGRILAKDVAIDRDQPGFDRSTMDGFAIVPDGDRTRFVVRGELTAGQVYEGQLGPGDALRIMTGAPAPSGTTVVPIERTDWQDGAGEVTLDHAPVPGSNIAWRGEDARRGDVLVARGTRLAPAHLSVAAMAGATELEVQTPPSVCVVTTGDEVGAAGAAGIRDSNGPLLDGLLVTLGARVRRRHARDQEGELEDALRAAADGSDVVVTTGGVSMGSRDLVPQTLAALGFETVFHKVQVQPGKPILVARRGDGALFVGLPGNPVSVLATAHLFLFPAMSQLLAGWQPRFIELPMAQDFEHGGRRHLFLPARVDAGGLAPMRWNGSGDLIAAAAADGLVELPIGSRFGAGDRARFMPYLGHALAERALLPPREERAQP